FSGPMSGLITTWRFWRSTRLENAIKSQAPTTRWYSYCALCDTNVQNYKQIIMHPMDPAHIEKDVVGSKFSVDLLLSKIIGNLRQKYDKLDPQSPKLRPTFGFVDHLSEKYGDAAFDYMGTSLAWKSDHA
ncbi:hypothetical protein PFISCL1PPCAC_23363, partial [Pristionchus fissidentatus]